MPFMWVLLRVDRQEFSNSCFLLHVLKRITFLLASKHLLFEFHPWAMRCCLVYWTLICCCHYFFVTQRSQSWPLGPLSLRAHHSLRTSFPFWHQVFATPFVFSLPQPQGQLFPELFPWRVALDSRMPVVVELVKVMLSHLFMLVFAVREVKLSFRHAREALCHWVLLVTGPVSELWPWDLFSGLVLLLEQARWLSR